METKKMIASLPVGYSFFDDLLEHDCYYVDKTLLVKDLLDKRTKVTLCTRPRRFGKTLNQSMLKCFFEDTALVGGKNTRALFNGLKIESAGEQYLQHQGKYPVVFMSFKSAKCSLFEDSYDSLKDELVSEFKRHRYVFETISDDKERAFFEKLSSGEGDLKEYAKSLRFLCECLEKYHGQKAVILIDEYDVPLENAWVKGF